MSPNNDENTHHNWEWHIVTLLCCQILVTPSAPLLCYTNHVVVMDCAVAGNVMLFGCQIMVTQLASLLCYTHHVNVKDRAVAGIVMLFGCHTGHAIGVFLVSNTPCCCERPCCSGNRHAVWLSDNGYSIGGVMLFGCHTGHAIGVFVVLYTTCYCEGPCWSGSRHAVWLSYWSRHRRLWCVKHTMLLWKTVL